MESIRKLQEKEKTECQSIHLLPGNPIFKQSKEAVKIGRLSSATFDSTHFPPKNFSAADPSFYFRNKDLKKDNFPAANSYKTENVWPQGETKRPSYSMSSRTRYTQKENVPAPNRYSLPVLIGPKINISNKR